MTRSTEVFRVVYQAPNGQWLTAHGGEYTNRFGAVKRLDAFRAVGHTARLERWYRDADGTYSQAPPTGRYHEAANALYVAAIAILEEFDTSSEALAVLRNAVEDYYHVTRGAS